MWTALVHIHVAVPVQSVNMCYLDYVLGLLISRYLLCFLRAPCTAEVITTIKITPFNSSSFYRKQPFASCITRILQHIILFTIVITQHRLKFHAIAVLWLNAGFDIQCIYENCITSGSKCMYLNCLPDSEVLAVIIGDGVPSPTDVLAVTEQSY